MFPVRFGLGVLAFVAVSLYGVAIALLRRDKRFVARDYARSLARWMDAVLGTRVRVVGEENLRRTRPCIYISNHQALLDVPVLGRVYPEDTVIIGKEALRRIPLFGWLFQVTGNVFINRSDRSDAVGRLKNAETAIRERGVSVWIFPEGTRGAGTGRLLPFKKGAFHMAVATGVPLIPVVVSPLRHLWDLRRARIRPGDVEVRVLEPIPTRSLSAHEVPTLMADTHQRMQAALDAMAAGAS